MSVFFLPGQAGLSEQEAGSKLQDITSKRNLSIPAGTESDYAQLLQAADIAVQHVLSLPEYVDPRLKPVRKDAGTARKYSRLTGDDNPLNAWSHKISNDDDAQISASGPLNGASVAFKDNISVGDLPLTCGTFAPHFCGSDAHPISQIDATVVSRVLAAGGRLAGTATCENYSMCALSYSSATGIIDNPWGPGHATGGSSSGCGALLAVKAARSWHEKRGLPFDITEPGLDLAVGGDQGGSIRIPAAYSGVYGLKPTRGLVPYTGIVSLHPLIDHCGPMSTSVLGIATLLGVLAGADGLDPRATPDTPRKEAVPDYRASLEAEIQKRQDAGQWDASSAATGLRVGILKEAWDVSTLNAEVGSVVRRAADKFASLGATVEEVSIPIHASGPAIWTAVTRLTGMAPYAVSNQTLPFPSYPFPGLSPPALNNEWLDTMSKYNPAVPNVVFCGDYLNDKYPQSVAAKAMMHVHELTAAYDAALERFDVLITPANPTVAPAHPKDEDGVMDRIMLAAGNTANLCPFNATGHPGLCIPAGWASAPTKLGKLPVGMQIIGRRGDENTLLLAASAWEVGGMGLDSE